MRNQLHALRSMYMRIKIKQWHLYFYFHFNEYFAFLLIIQNYLPKYKACYKVLIENRTYMYCFWVVDAPSEILPGGGYSTSPPAHLAHSAKPFQIRNSLIFFQNLLTDICIVYTAYTRFSIAVAHGVSVIRSRRSDQIKLRQLHIFGNGHLTGLIPSVHHVLRGVANCKEAKYA